MLYTGGGWLSHINARIFTKFENCTAVFCFGATEIAGGGLAKRLTNASDAAEPWLERFGDRIFEVVDGDGRQCPAGVEGQLRIALKEFDCQHYINDAAATERCFRNGYFYTGDTAVDHADGRVKVLGRTNDVVIVRGLKVAVEPIEDEIRRALRIGDVCVFSGPSADGR
jgi:acyl-coenzyme A synthetase/AMP-(fatty) acid ligase